MIWLFFQLIPNLKNEPNHRIIPNIKMYTLFHHKNNGENAKYQKKNPQQLYIIGSILNTQSILMTLYIIPCLLLKSDQYKHMTRIDPQVWYFLPPFRLIQCYFEAHKLIPCTVQNFKKELHLPSPFAKAGDLFWPDFPRFRFFVYQGVANRKDWSK